MASIHKRAQLGREGTPGRSSWQVKYRDPEGRSRSKSFRKKAEAERFRTSVEHSKLAGSYVDPAVGREPFRSYAERWRTGRSHRAGTAALVEQHLRLHVYPAIGSRPIGLIRQGEIQALVADLETRLAPSTVEVVYGRVVAIFRAAVRDRTVSSSPCFDVQRRRPVRQPTPHVLTTNELYQLSEAIVPRYRALILTGAATGLRPGELFGLTVDRVDFLNKTIRVDRQLTRTPQGVLLAPPKTSASYRTIPVPVDVVDMLAAQLTKWPQEPEFGLVFTNSRHAPIQQSPFGSVFATARDRAGLPTWATPHDLRHYYASLLIASGASAKVVQTRLGHESIKTTFDIYGHLFPEEADRTRLAVAETLFSDCSTEVSRQDVA